MNRVKEMERVLYKDNAGNAFILESRYLTIAEVLDDLISLTSTEDRFLHSILADAWDKWVMEGKGGYV